MNLFGNTISTLEQGLNYSTTKGKAISQNIANVDTPNYKVKNVSFKKVFTEVKASNLEAYRTDSRHINFSGKGRQSEIFSNSNFSYRHDCNGVEIGRESGRERG